MKTKFIVCLLILVVNTVFGSNVPEVTSTVLNLSKVFNGSPIIYSVLLLMSIFSLMLWMYSLLTLRLNDMIPKEFVENLREQISKKDYESALEICQQDNNFCSSIIASGIAVRKHGPQVIIDTMESEGRRLGMNLWQRISVLNDIAVIAPMLGLLGTVLGLFYAFYDNTQSIESMTSIFDGLGIAIGTTVAGLIVAILATIFQTTLKFRVVKLLNVVENETVALANIITAE